MLSVELTEDGEDVSRTWKSTKTPLDSLNETSILMTDTPEAQMVTDIESLNSASLMIEGKYEVEFEHLDKLVVYMDNKEVDSQLENILACEKNGSCKNHEDFQNDSHRCIENADTEFSSMVLIEKKTENWMSLTLLVVGCKIKTC
ncbi:hypothetical protein DPMN_082766 [Dreissena polymorpha]|uniref:Uncharacterized protein n=1 Tax=Dreissena polymorpha TaxID=45954 RepID=A0A9D3YB63_DREPO|nr:hypothetical protein DPMN_082766 [Dreissena polymorpha]